jgi:hypothetical protein
MTDAKLTLDLDTLPTELLMKIAGAFSEAEHGRKHGPYRATIDRINAVVAQRRAAQFARFAAAKAEQERRRMTPSEAKP